MALVGGTLIDDASADPLPDAVVAIQAGRIATLGKSTQGKVPKTAQVINARVHGLQRGRAKVDGDVALVMGRRPNLDRELKKKGAGGAK